MIIRAKYGPHAAIQDSDAHSRQLRLAHQQQVGQQEQQQQHQQQHDLHPDHPPQQQPQAAPPAGNLPCYTVKLCLLLCVLLGACALACHPTGSSGSLGWSCITCYMAVCRLQVMKLGFEQPSGPASLVGCLLEVLASLHFANCPRCFA